VEFLVGRGLFNRELHKVQATNATRLHGQGRDFALSECGKACVVTPVPAMYSFLVWCADCAKCVETEAIAAAVIPAQLSDDLMRRVLTGLQRL
jgi:hypothetical protein